MHASDGGYLLGACMILFLLYSKTAGREASMSSGRMETGGNSGMITISLVEWT